MERSTIILAIALVVVTGTASAVIWEQHKQILALEAREPAGPGVADLLDQLKVQDAPPVATAVATASSESETPASASVAVDPSVEVTQQAPARTGRDRATERAAAFAELLADPEISRLMLNQRKAELDSRYAALFQKLGLSPADTEKLKELLAERTMSRMEAGAMARAEGVGRDDRDGMRDVMRAAEAEADAELAAFLGPDRYNTLETYEQTGRERAAVNQFTQRLSYSPAPLQGYQADALVRVLTEVKQPRSPGRNATAAESVAYMSALESYNSEISSRAKGILSPQQFEALGQMQQEQMDRLRLSELMPRWGGDRAQAGPPGGGR